jgi:nucleoredoxin
VLTKLYKQWKAAGKSIEVVFVTSDQDEKAFKGYFAEQGGWVAFPFGDDRIKKAKTQFGIQGIPSLIVLNGEGKVVDAQGRTTVMSQQEKSIDKWLA